MNFRQSCDAQMKAAFARKGIPLWVPPSEAGDYLASRRWSEQICIELREWFARAWSNAFAAGYRKVQQPTVNRSDVYQTLIKMNYSSFRANELADVLVDGLPGLYKKGASLSGIALI